MPWIRPVTPPEDPRRLHRFGMGLFVLLTLTGVVLLWKDHRVAGQASVVLAAGVGAVGLWAPARLALVFRLWMRLAKTVAWINTALLLSLVFFGILVPLRLLMRAMGQDLLGRKKREGSYWQAVPRHSLGDRHFDRQY